MEMGRYEFLRGLRTLNVGELIVIILSPQINSMCNDCFIAYEDISHLVCNFLYTL